MQLGSVRTTNASHKYPRGRDQNEYKFTIFLFYKFPINLPWCIILKSHKIRGTFYTENTLCKLLCKPKDRVATKDKNNTVYETDCGNSEAVYFGEFKRSLKSHSDEHQRSVRNCDCDKNEIAKHCWETNHNFSWDQKKVKGKQVNSYKDQRNHTFFEEF